MSPLQAPEQVIYPDSDGQPMSDNTKQFEYIVTIQGGLDALFQSDPNVFVAGDLLWYPVEGKPKVCQAPDVMVAFGRPKGHRGSYKQWEEGGIAPQVVFEVVSPSNTVMEMSRKFAFYQSHGVEEYYIYDPDRGELSGYVRAGNQLQEIENLERYVSPRLHVRFELSGSDLLLFGPDGKPFLTYTELAAERSELAAERDELAAERDELAAERDELAAERDEERRRAAVLRDKLRELGIDPPA